MAGNKHPQRVAAEHFQDLPTQHRASELGMWVFLGSETLLFGALIGLYTAFALLHPDAFHHAADHNNRMLGTMMTVVLIASSFGVAWAMHAIERDARRQCLTCLGLTLLLGAVFLGMKAHEYLGHFDEGIFWGKAYAFEALSDNGARLFFTLYFALTGLHALHVIAGMLVLGLFTVSVARGKIDAIDHHRLELGGLYWHLVDIVWIFLWPLLYLT